MTLATSADDASGAISAPDPEWLLETMLFARRIEEWLVEMVTSRQLTDTVLHVAIGQEAAAVGVAAHRRDGDVLFSSHRGLAHCLAWGADPVAILSETLGRLGGAARGLAGHMHLFDPAAGLLGTNGIVGGGIAQAVGAAVGLRLQGRPGVAISFFGDGAINTGAFHEGLNLAAVWSAPVLFVCEDNGFAEMTATAAFTAGTATGRAACYGIATERVAGTDVEAVAAAADRLLAHVRAGAGPALLHVDVFRADGHWVGDPEHYREPEEKGSFGGRDPIPRLIASSGLATSRVQAIEHDVAQRVGSIVAHVLAAAEPGPRDVQTAWWSARVDA